MKFFAEAPDGVEQSLVGIEVALRFNALPFTDALRELVVPFYSRCGNVETAFDLALLSDVPPPFGLYCVCHGHVEESTLRQLCLTIRRKPESPPPKFITETSSRVGGFPAGVSTLISALGTQHAKGRGTLLVVVTDPKRWPLKFRRRRTPTDIGGFRHEEEEVHFEHADQITDATVTFLPKDSSFSIKVSSPIETELDLTCFENASAQLWAKVQPLFKTS
jgi:hypothetical protein